MWCLKGRRLQKGAAHEGADAGLPKGRRIAEVIRWAWGYMYTKSQPRTGHTRGKGDETRPGKNTADENNTRSHTPSGRRGRQSLTRTRPSPPSVLYKRKPRLKCSKCSTMHPRRLRTDTIDDSPDRSGERAKQRSCAERKTALRYSADRRAVRRARALSVRPARWGASHCKTPERSDSCSVLFLSSDRSRHPPCTPSFVTRGALRFVTSSVGVARCAFICEVTKHEACKALFSTPFPCAAKSLRKKTCTLRCLFFLFFFLKAISCASAVTPHESSHDATRAARGCHGIGKVPKLHTDCRAVAHFPARSRPGSYKAIPSVG